MYLLTSFENCALSIVPADKRTEKERERKRLEPTVCGRIVGILRIISLNLLTSEIKYKHILLSTMILYLSRLSSAECQVRPDPSTSMTRLKSDA